MGSEGNGKKSEVGIRRADLSDLDDLVVICRECFPDSLKHNAFGPIARKRWAQIVSSPFMETYLATIHGKTAGFYVLKTDFRGYQQEGRSMSNVDKVIIGLAPLSGLFMKPVLLGKVIRKAIKKKPVSSAGDLRTNGNVPQESSIEKIAWGEIRATSPGYQKMGIARELNKAVINRCRELKKEILGGNVDELNVAVRSFLESLGYVVAGRVRNRIIYKKQL